MKTVAAYLKADFCWAAAAWMLLSAATAPAQEKLLRNASDHDLWVAWAYVKDESVAGLGNQAHDDPDPRRVSWGWTKLPARGAVTMPATGQYLYVMAVKGTARLQIAPAKPSRTKLFAFSSQKWNTSLPHRYDDAEFANIVGKAKQGLRAESFHSREDFQRNGEYSVGGNAKARSQLEAFFAGGAKPGGGGMSNGGSSTGGGGGKPNGGSGKPNAPADGNSVVAPFRATFRNGTGRKVGFALSANGKILKNFSLEPGKGGTFSVLLPGGTTASVLIFQSDGTSRPFSVKDGGKYAFGERDGAVINFFDK